MDNYVITIARGFGSGGKEIGSKLAQRLNIPCYEKQILEMASAQSGIGENKFEKVDEKLKGSYLLNCLKKFSFSEKAEANETEFKSDEDLFRIQTDIIKNLAQTQSCVIIGKCADRILRYNDNVVSVYIEAPRADCAESVMKKMGVTLEEANKLIKKTDKYRADYYKFYSGGHVWTDPINYDMTLNSARVGRDECVTIIEEYVKRKFSKA